MPFGCYYTQQCANGLEMRLIDLSKFINGLRDFCAYANLFGAGIRNCRASYDGIFMISKVLRRCTVQYTQSASLCCLFLFSIQSSREAKQKKKNCKTFPFFLFHKFIYIKCGALYTQYIALLVHRVQILYNTVHTHAHTIIQFQLKLTYSHINLTKIVYISSVHYKSKQSKNGHKQK